MDTGAVINKKYFSRKRFMPNIKIMPKVVATFGILYDNNQGKN